MNRRARRRWSLARVAGRVTVAAAAVCVVALVAAIIWGSNPLVNVSGVAGCVAVLAFLVAFYTPSDPD